MSVAIRLARHGRHKRPYYRIIVADKERARNGRYLEHIGSLNPLTDPVTVTLKEDRVKHWVGVGAKPSGALRSIINREMPGFLDEIEGPQKTKIQEKRAKRKARSKDKPRREKSESKKRKLAHASREKPEPPVKQEAAPQEAATIEEAAPEEATVEETVEETTE